LVTREYLYTGLPSRYQEMVAAEKVEEIQPAVFAKEA